MNNGIKTAERQTIDSHADSLIQSVTFLGTNSFHILAFENWY